MFQPSINFSNHEDVCTALHSASTSLRTNKSRVGCVHHLPASGQVLVTGDLHDNPVHFSKIIQLAELDIPTNHVVLQELIHSGGDSSAVDFSYRMLVRVAALVIAYPTQVHPILANHELSQATGRLITKGGDELVEKFILGVRQVFGKHAETVIDALNTFILAMPLAVQSKTGLMCLHSLPNELTMDEFDEEILLREMRPADYRGPFGSAYMTVWGRQYGPEQIATLAEHRGVTLFCLGHAWVPSGIDMATASVLLINSDHNNGVVLPIQLDNIQSAGKSMKSAIPLSSVLIDSSAL